MRNKTWTLVPEPKNRNDIGCKLVFRAKNLPLGALDKKNLM